MKTTMNVMARKWIILTVGTALGIVGVQLITPGQVQMRTVAAPRQEDGDELVFVYIGRSSCRFCAMPNTQRMVREAMDSTRGNAQRNGLRFMSIGIALDNDWEAGITHLKQVTRFDQVVAGGGWMNELGLRYMHAVYPGPSATPQVVVLRRFIQMRRGSAYPNYRRLGEVLSLRLEGTQELNEWLRNGTPIPDQNVDRIHSVTDW